MLLLLSAVVIAGLCNVWSFVIFFKLGRYRTDIAPGQSPFGGSSKIWQFNVMSPSNYTEQGRQLLPIFIFSIIASVVSSVIALWALSLYL